MHFQVWFRGFTGSDTQIWHEGANGSADLKCNIKFENKAVIDHLR